jgi:hypothetical protein
MLPLVIMPPLGLTDGDTIIIQWTHDGDRGRDVQLHADYHHGTPVSNEAGRRNTFTFIYDAGQLCELSASTEYVDSTLDSG